jgi:hypothetical protein
MKTLQPIHAKAQEVDEQAAWFAGLIPRRLLAIPFGGPIPSPKSKRGVDLDDEFFSERTDIFGPHRALRQNRERLVDFSHSAKSPGPGFGDPTGMMTGHFLGKSILDPDPEEDGWWVDIWFERGNKRVALVEALARRGAQLFGSSQPVGPVSKASNGEILVWPFWLETLSPAPQNTLSVITPKAALDELPDGSPFYGRIEEALRSLSHDLRSSSAMGTDASKAGQADLTDALLRFDAASDKLRATMQGQREEPTQ